MSTILTLPCVTAGPTLTDGGLASCRPVCSPFTLTPGYWTLGKWWHVYLAGKLSSTILDGRGTLNQLPGYAQFQLRLGGATVWDGGASLLNPLVAFADAPWSLDLVLRCVAISDAGLATFRGSARFTCADVAGMSATQPTAAGVALLPWNTAPAVGGGVNAFAALDVDVFSASGSGTGSRTVLDYWIEEV